MCKADAKRRSNPGWCLERWVLPMPGDEIGRLEGHRRDESS